MEAREQGTSSEAEYSEIGWTERSSLKPEFLFPSVGRPQFSLKAAFLVLQDTLPYIWESSLRGSSESSI